LEPRVGKQYPSKAFGPNRHGDEKRRCIMRSSKLLPGILLPMAAVLLFGCRDNPAGPDEFGAQFEAEFELVVLPQEVRLEAGQSLKLSVMARDREGGLIPLTPGAAVAWSSSDEGIVEVGEDGTVVARAAGLASITAGCDGRCAWATIYVTPPFPPNG
jgi:hypothetical protein